MRQTTAISGELSYHDLTEQNTLVVGAPSVGKSHTLRAAGLAPTKSLTNAEPSKAVVAIDDLYLALHRSDGTRDALADLLSGEEAVTIAVRPRELDWLIAHDDTGVDPELLSLINEVVLLRFDEETDRQHFVGVVEQYWEQEGEGAASEAISTVRATCETLVDEGTLSYPDYQFKNKAITETLNLDRYERTLVPGLVTYVSYEAIEEGIVPDGIRNLALDTIGDTLSYLGVDWSEQVFSALGGAVNAVIPNGIDVGGFDSNTVEQLVARTGPLAGLTVAGPGAMFGAIGLLYCTLTTRSLDIDDVEEAFDCLLANELTPPARAQLETRLDLPPRTLDNLFELGQPRNAQRLQQLVELDPDAIDTLEKLADANAEVFTAVAELDNQLDTDARQAIGLISEVMQESVNSLNDLESELRRQERELLGSSADVERDTIPGISPNKLGVGDVAQADGTRLLPIDQIVESLTGPTPSAFVLARGPKGTGKTTAIYRAGQRLTAAGYELVQPRFVTASGAFVERVIRNVVPRDDILLYVPYGDSIDAVSPGNTEQLNVLRRLVDDGVCVGVILECRSELYEQLDSDFIDAGGLSEIERRYWKSKALVEFSRGTDEEIAGLVTDLVDIVRSEPLQESIVNEIVRLAAGNPEVAKLATRAALDEGGDLTQFDTAPQLIRKRIFASVEDGSLAETLFHVLAVTGWLETETLVEVIDKVGASENIDSPRQLVAAAEPLVGYLNREVAEAVKDTKGFGTVKSDLRWRIEPDVFSDAIFLDTVGMSSDHNPPFRTVYLALDETLPQEELTDVSDRIAQNFVRAYGAIRPRSSRLDASAVEELRANRQDIADLAKVFLEERAAIGSDLESFANCLEIIITGGVPMAPAVVKDKLNDLLLYEEEHSGLPASVAGSQELSTIVMPYEEHSSTSSPTSTWNIQRIVSRLFINHLRLPETEADREAVSNLLMTFVENIQELSDNSFDLVLIGTYGISIAQLPISFDVAPPALEEDTQIYVEEILNEVRSTWDPADARGAAATAEVLSKVLIIALAAIAGRTSPYSEIGANRTPEETSNWLDAVDTVIRTYGPLGGEKRSNNVSQIYGRVINRMIEPGQGTIYISKGAEMEFHEGSPMLITSSQETAVEAWVPTLVERLLAAKTDSYVDSQEGFIESALVSMVSPRPSKLNGFVFVGWRQALIEAVRTLVVSLDMEGQATVTEGFPMDVLRRVILAGSPTSYKEWGQTILVPVLRPLLNLSSISDDQYLLLKWGMTAMDTVVQQPVTRAEDWPAVITEWLLVVEEEIDTDSRLNHGVPARLYGAIISRSMHYAEQGDTPAADWLKWIIQELQSSIETPPSFHQENKTKWNGTEFILSTLITAIDIKPKPSEAVYNRLIEFAYDIIDWSGMDHSPKPPAAGEDSMKSWPHGEPIKIDPSTPEEHHTCAQLLRIFNSKWTTEEADIHYEQAINAEPKVVDYRLNYAEFLAYDCDDLDAAREQYERARKQSPGNPRAHLGSARVAQRLNRYEEAYERYKTVVELIPEEPSPLYELALLLEKNLDKTDVAREYYARAAEHNTENPMVNVDYAEYLIDIENDFENARTQFDRAIEIAPHDAEIHRRYATALENHGENKEAARYRRQAAKLERKAEE